MLNLAVNGYNPYNEAALLADRGTAYQPDLVLVEFGVAAISPYSFSTVASSACSVVAIVSICRSASASPSQASIRLWTT